MATVQKKSFDTPDETRTPPKTKVEVVSFGDRSVMKLTLEPGWKWSEHVKPTAGTSSCCCTTRNRHAWASPNKRHSAGLQPKMIACVSKSA